MPKQAPLNLDFTKIWPGGIEHFADAERNPPTPKKPEPKKSPAKDPKER